jgi:hypothetical protein
MRILTVLLLTLTGHTACSQPAASKADRLSVSGDFAGGSEMSGLASADGRRFVFVSNETRVAQVATIDFAAKKIAVGATLAFPGAPGEDEMDLEGVACDPATGFYFVTGSHCVSKKKAKPRVEQQLLFRFKLDEAGGMTDYRLGSLTTVLQSLPEVSASIGQPLQEFGLNIEGLAHWNGKLWVGLRAPLVADKALLVEMDPTAPFSATPPAGTKVHQIALGKRQGVRDLAAAKNGLVIVSGASGAPKSDKLPASSGWDGDTAFGLWSWAGPGQEAKQLAELEKQAGGVEGVYVVSESETDYQTLLLRDGQANGGPQLLSVSK